MVHMLLILYFLQAANRNLVFLQHVIEHLELYLSAPPPPMENCARCAQLSRLCQATTTHDNMLMYRALLNSLYSLENKPLYFPVICKVLKKMQYTNDIVSFLLRPVLNMFVCASA